MYYMHNYNLRVITFLYKNIVGSVSRRFAGPSAMSVISFDNLSSMNEAYLLVAARAFVTG